MMKTMILESTALASNGVRTFGTVEVSKEPKVQAEEIDMTNHASDRGESLFLRESMNPLLISPFFEGEMRLK